MIRHDQSGARTKSWNIGIPILAMGWGAIVLVLLATGVSAQDDAKAAPAGKDEAAVRQAIANYRKAVEAGDLDAVAQCWTPDADYVDHLGHAFKVEAALAAAMTKAEEEGGIARPPLKTDTLAIRFVTPDVAVEDGVIERPAPTADQLGKGRYSAVWVFRDGKWLIDSVRESPYNPVTSSNHFQGLEWMVGEWTAEGPQGTADMICTWGPNKTYMLRQMKLTPKGETPITATQWIGWDPTHERVHSFIFDSQGGYGEGDWTQDGNAWIVSVKGVLPTGRHTSATNIYTRLDDNNAIWESVEEEVEGQPGRDFHLRATRKPAKK